MKRQNGLGNIRKRGNHCWEGCVMVDNQRYNVYGKTYQEVQKKLCKCERYHFGQISGRYHTAHIAGDGQDKALRSPDGAHSTVL